MKICLIKEIRIDTVGRLLVFPEKEQFPFIWRSATEVHWDDKGLFLYSPKPREWPYFNWYTQIVSAVKSEYGVELLPKKDTIWSDISDDLKNQILTFSRPQII
jgi:hypothetical protein